MSKLLAVARWEYVEKIKSKAFIISLILIPVLMIGIGIAPGLLASRQDSATKVIGVIDRSGDLLQPLARYLDTNFRLDDGRPNYLLRALGSDPGSLEKAKHLADSLVVEGEIEGYLIIPATIFRDSSVEYRSENVGNIRVTERLSSAIRDILIQKKLDAQGIDAALVKELTTPVSLRTIKVSKGGEEESSFLQIFFTSYLFMMMMMFLVITSGQLLVRSMLEEKSNRVVEVLISSCSSRELMAGKILGLSGLGLTQLAVWAVIGAIVSLKLGLTMVPPLSAALLFLYFVLGYLFYAAIFVALGAPVSTEQEAQQLTSYLSLLLILPVILAVPIIQDPNSLMVRVLTFIPLVTPTMMAMRIPISMPSAIEVVASLTLLTVSAIAMMWAAGKIFRVAILSYGRRPGFRELLGYLTSD
jgi:ABC-2 type transport system permease protein